MSRRERWLSIGGLLVAVLVWGASFSATKVALRQVSPVTVVWLRFSMGLPILAVAARLRGDLGRVPRRTLAHFALLGFIGITFHQWLQSNALQTAGAGTAAWIVTTTPVFIALLGRLFLSERLAPSRVAGIALAALGVILVVGHGAPGPLAPGRFGTVGDLLLLVSSLNWAVFSVMSRRSLGQHAAAKMLLYVMASGWLFTSILFVGSGRVAEIARLTASGWLAVSFLGVACSGLAYIFWYDGLRALSAARAGVFLYLEPLAATAVAAVVLGEPVRRGVLAGGALILAGVWVVNRPELPAADRAGPSHSCDAALDS